MQAQAPTPGPAPGSSSAAAAAAAGNGRRSSGASYTNILAANLLNRSSGASAGGNVSPASSRTAGLGGSKPASAIGAQDAEATTSVGRAASQMSKAGGPRLRAEGIMAPPASDAATLRRQVAALQMDLETHVENEKRLQALNQQLRDRLELYMQQNHENVERAETELNTLHEDMEQTLDLQRRLAQRATSLEKEKRELENALERSLTDFEAERSALQSRITRLSEELLEKSQSQSRSRAIQAELEHAIAAKKQLEDELNSSCIETDFLKHKADEYSNELQTLLLKRQREAVIEESFRRNLLRRSLCNFKKAVEERRLVCSHDHTATEFANGKVCKRGIHALQLATKRAMKMREAYERQAKAGLEDCWKGWRLVTIAEKKYLTAVQRRKQSSLCSAVCNWRSIMEMGKMTKEEELQLTKLALKHWRRLKLKQYFKRWDWWLRACARPKRAKMQAIQGHLNQLIRRQALYAWKSSVRTQQISKLKKEQAYRHGALACKRRALARWLEFMGCKQGHQVLKDKASSFHSSHQRKSVVTCWSNFVGIQRQKRHTDAFAFKKYLYLLIGKAFSIWRHNVKLQKAEQKAVKEVNQALKRASLLVWRDFLVLVAIKQKKEMKALVNKKRKEYKTARTFLIFWWEEMAWRRRAGQVTRLFSMRRHRTLLVSTLHGWIHATFDNLLVANARYQTELCEAKALCDEHKQQTTIVDVENLQLIDRLHAMSSEIALLKVTIAEKEKQEEELRRALEDGAVIEGSLQGDLEQQTMRIHELEVDIVNLQKKLQTKNLQDTAGEVHHALEIQNLERTLKDLQTQLAEKTVQLDSYEKALKDTAEKLEGASDESQEKLSSAFEIAASLRRLLEDRENQCAILEGTCRRKEVELGEAQKKLSAATSKFSETLEARDSRIQELENILMRKQQEMQEAQQEYQELQRSLENKEASVRRLEYEMKLKHDRESQRAKAFVSGLTTWTEAGTPKRESPHILESMRSVYNQARAALQEGAASGDQQYVLWSRDDQRKKSSEILDDQPEVREMGAAGRWTVPEEEPSGENTERSSSDEEEVEADDKVSISRGPYVTEAGSMTANSSLPASEAEGDQKRAADKVESLHEEIQQLQARIMSRLRDSSPP